MTLCANAPADSAVESPDPRPTAQQLWNRYHQHGDSPTEDALVEEYLPLVRAVWGRLVMSLPDHVDQDDLQSAGLIGLLHALRHYDPGCGTSFETYARRRIRGAMLDELRRMDWVPRGVHERARRIQEALARLEQQLGRIPTEVEAARALNLSPPAYRSLLDQIRPATFVCLDATTNSEEGETPLGDLVADPVEDSPVDQVCRRELALLIRERLKELPDNQRKVLALYYGEDLHLREIAAAMGVTESRVCQIHSQAILSIRAYLQQLEAETISSGTALT